jgi:hypothetical protein
MRTFLGTLGHDEALKMADVLCVYREVAVLRAAETFAAQKTAAQPGASTLRSLLLAIKQLGELDDII